MPLNHILQIISFYQQWFCVFTEEASNVPSSTVESIHTNGDDDSDNNDSNNTASSADENVVDSTVPPNDRKQQHLSELQKLKDNCKSEDLQKLKTKCEILVRDCIAGLLIQLSDTEFKSMEGKIFDDLFSN